MFFSILYSPVEIPTCAFSMPRLNILPSHVAVQPIFGISPDPSRSTSKDL